MSNIIRKISIGADYKNEAMHYAVGQSVYGGHSISNILFEEKDNSYNIFITKEDEVLPWKSLTLIWQYQLSMIFSTNGKLIQIYRTT